MKKLRCLLFLLALSLPASAQRTADQALATKILQDVRLDTIQHRARRLLTGFTAGTSYGEVWIRDFNMFIIGSLSGRFIQALTKYGLAAEAYAELNPMLERTLANKGFHEWYDVRTGAPKGSGEFRGEAGVLLDAITMLRSWAKAHQ